MYFYYEIVLRNEKLQSSSNQVPNFVSRTFTTKKNMNGVYSFHNMEIFLP